MVVDRYTYRLLCALGVEIEEYEELQGFFMRGVEENLARVYALYGKGVDLAYVYARFHAKIVGFAKAKRDMRLIL